MYKYILFLIKDLKENERINNIKNPSPLLSGHWPPPLPTGNGNAIHEWIGYAEKNRVCAPKR